MRDLSAVIDSMIDVAKAAAPLIPQGEAAVVLVERVIEMVDHVRENFGVGDDVDAAVLVDQLVKHRNELAREVEARVTKTVAALREAQ